MARAIMIQGTGSNVGKSMLVAGLARAFRHRGLSVAPFKPQNMSNNAAVTEDGGEIGRAQAMQARGCRAPTSVHMNPVLLKPESETGSQIIVQGQRFGSMRAREYGTHKAELRLWKEAGIDAQAASGGWYRETGSGMGATLNFAVQAQAYTISDRATWLAFGNKAGHDILFEGDPNLFNQYGVIPVSPTRCPMIEHQAALAFRDWLVSPDGQAAIAAFEKHGSQLFFPNADRKKSTLAARQRTVTAPPSRTTANVN